MANNVYRASGERSFGDTLPLPGETADEYNARMQKMGVSDPSMSPLPGETLSQFHLRMNDNGLASNVENPNMIQDQYRLARLKQDEEAGSRKILGEQGDIQKQRLNDLASLLSQQTDRQFNRDIPEIANTAQGQGFLETSGFGNALSKDYKTLVEDQNAQILKQGLSDRDLQIQGIGQIGANNNSLDTGGLERTYSTEDLTRSENLAEKLGRMGVSAPAPQMSSSDRMLQNAGPILSGIGAVKGAA